MTLYIFYTNLTALSLYHQDHTRAHVSTIHNTTLVLLLVLKINSILAKTKTLLGTSLQTIWRPHRMYGDWRGGGVALWGRTYLHFQVMVTKNGFTARRKQRTFEEFSYTSPSYLFVISEKFQSATYLHTSNYKCPRKL